MITLDEIEAVCEYLQEWRDEINARASGDTSLHEDLAEGSQALDQAIEIIEALAADVNQARRALLEINYFTAEALGEKIGRVDDEPSEG